MGLRDPIHPNYVSLLKESLYGLKQAPRIWYQWFADFVSTIGFYHSKSDRSLFIYHKGSDMAYIVLYMLMISFLLPFMIIFLGLLYHSLLHNLI
uniref:Reverse transcriptase Ty1/copia-type domain-containing protein n=1 Tax=Cajanus cajan TaxID=3821 RepID=A0A151SYB2_CAJCA|nr:hypothetical protein KK1_015236 [Cajanus cajan]